MPGNQAQRNMKGAGTTVSLSHPMDHGRNLPMSSVAGYLFVHYLIRTDVLTVVTPAPFKSRTVVSIS